MSVCERCNREMNEAEGCVMRLVETTDGTFNPVTYGQERRYATRPPSPGDQQHGVIVGDPPGCHDCGAIPGGFHHAGCDYEECPRYATNNFLAVTVCP